MRSNRTSITLLLVLMSLLCLAQDALPEVIEKQLPPGPELYRPEMNSSILEDTVTLQWQYFENANLFRVQAALNRNFDPLFLDTTTSYHFYTLNDLPRDGSKIFWRVRACILTEEEENPNMENLICISEWSTAYAFFTGIPTGEGEEEAEEEDTNFFRRVFGCERIDEEDSLLSRLRDWLPLLISMLVVLQIHTPKVNS